MNVLRWTVALTPHLKPALARNDRQAYQMQSDMVGNASSLKWEVGPILANCPFSTGAAQQDGAGDHAAATTQRSPNRDVPFAPHVKPQFV
jgi:hypothetical protein